MNRGTASAISLRSEAAARLYGDWLQRELV